MSKQYLYRVSILNRKNSHPLEAISYYSGQSQFDANSAKKYVSNTVDKVLWNKIVLPNSEEQYDLYRNLPEFVKFRTNKKDLEANARNILWKTVDSTEVREDAQFARVFELSIPSYVNQNEASDLLKEFAKNLINDGMIVDASLHSARKNIGSFSLMDKFKDDKNEKNSEEQSLDYVGFLVCTLRDYKDGQFINKNRAWNDRKKLENWRYKWVELLANQVLNSNWSEDAKNEWEEKLSIYNEYKKIKTEMTQVKKMSI